MGYTRPTIVKQAFPDSLSAKSAWLKKPSSSTSTSCSTRELPADSKDHAVLGDRTRSAGSEQQFEGRVDSSGLRLKPALAEQPQQLFARDRLLGRGLDNHRADP